MSNIRSGIHRKVWLNKYYLIVYMSLAVSVVVDSHASQFGDCWDGPFFRAMTGPNVVTTEVDGRLNRKVLSITSDPSSSTLVECQQGGSICSSAKYNDYTCKINIPSGGSFIGAQAENLKMAFGAEINQGLTIKTDIVSNEFCNQGEEHFMHCQANTVFICKDSVYGHGSTCEISKTYFRWNE